MPGLSNTNLYLSNFKINSHAIYQIEVLGIVDILWSENLAGMNVTNRKEGENYITTLIGMLKDQSALAGLLQTIFDMKLPILLIEYKG